MPSQARVLTLTLLAGLLLVFTIVTIAGDTWRWYYVVITAIAVYAAARDIIAISRYR